VNLVRELHLKYCTLQFIMFQPIRAQGRYSVYISTLTEDTMIFIRNERIKSLQI